MYKFVVQTTTATVWYIKEKLTFILSSCYVFVFSLALFSYMIVLWSQDRRHGTVTDRCTLNCWLLVMLMYKNETYSTHFPHCKSDTRINWIPKVSVLMQMEWLGSSFECIGLKSVSHNSKLHQHVAASVFLRGLRLRNAKCRDAPIPVLSKKLSIYWWQSTLFSTVLDQ